VVGRRTETGSPEVLTKRKGDGGRKCERSGSGIGMGRRINALRIDDNHMTHLSGVLILVLHFNLKAIIYSHII
jgi:hypothetical protein